MRMDGDGDILYTAHTHRHLLMESIAVCLWCWMFEANLQLITALFFPIGLMYHLSVQRKCTVPVYIYMYKDFDRSINQPADV